MSYWRNGTLLRNRTHSEARVSFVELFFDLVYVFAVTQISHYLLGHLTLIGAAQSLILWFAVWLIWQYNAWVTNWFDPETMPIRLLQFTLMLIGLVLAAIIPTSFAQGGLIFALCFVAIQVGRTVFVLFSLHGDHALTRNYQRILCWGFLSAAFWIAGGLATGEERLVLWLIAVLCDYIAPMVGFRTPLLGRSYTSEWTIDGAHLAERCQLFMIVALGETILITGASLSHHAHWDIPTLVGLIAAFLGTIAMWWIYFDTSSKDGHHAIAASDDPGRMGAYFHYVHVILVAGVIVSAVANELVFAHPAARVDTVSALTLIIGPALYLIGNLIYKRVVYNRWLKSHLLGLLALALLFPAAYLTDLLMINSLTTVLLLIIALTEGCAKRRNGCAA